MIQIKGSVTAPQGFKSNAVYSGIRKDPSRQDLALIYSEGPCACANVYTQNKVAGAPIVVTKQHCQDGSAQAILCNSGNANTCNANGIEIAEQACELVSQALHLPATEVIIASTGVIGQAMTIKPFADHIDVLADGLSSLDQSAQQAILTTDTHEKVCAYQFEIAGTLCTIGAMAKGSGMIHPNMATMLAFITTDTAITTDCLQTMLSAIVDETFNMVSVDGDTSTNDMVSVLANGYAQNPPIVGHGESYDTFYQALAHVCKDLSIMIAKDGEGASKLLTCNVLEASSSHQAKVLAKGIIASSLVKAAMFGRDANVGRILCAIGYSDPTVDLDNLEIYLRSAAGSICIGLGTVIFAFDEDKAYEILGEDEISIDVYLYNGHANATAWGCDLTYDYVKINSDYRS